jgi:ferredoxin
VSTETATFCVRTESGEIKNVHAPVGERLMPALRAAGYPIQAICGGEMSCGTCHILVDAPDFVRLNTPSADEQAMLDFLPEAVPGRSRLSCQIIVARDAEGCTIEVPPS